MSDPINLNQFGEVKMDWKPIIDQELADAVTYQWDEMRKLVAKKITIIFGLTPQEVGDFVVVEGSATLVPLNEEEKALVLRCKDKLGEQTEPGRTE